MLFTRRPGAVRLTLASLVVLHHTTTLHLGKFAVYSFFLLSGFWVVRIYREKYARSLGGVLRFYASRAMRILPIYVLCTSLTLLLFHRHEATFRFVARSFSVPVHELFGTNVLPPVWSLDVELQFYLLVPLLIVAGRAQVMRGLPTSARAAGIVAAAFGLLLVKATVFKFALFFALGIYLSEAKPRFSPAVVRSSLGVTALIGAALWWFGSPAVRDTYPLEVLMTLTFLPAIADSLRDGGSAQDRRIGELSYPLYLFHWIPAYYLRNRIGFYSGHDFTLQDLPLIVLAWTASAAGAIAIWRIVDLPMERLRRSWFEPRVRASTGALETRPALDAAQAD